MIKKVNKSKKENSLTSTSFICFVMLIKLIIQHLDSVQEVSIFQVDQLKFLEETTIDDYFNLENTLNFQHSDPFYEFSNEQNKIDFLQIHEDEIQEIQQLTTQKPSGQIKRMKLSTNGSVLSKQYELLLKFKENVTDKILFGQEYFNDFLLKSDNLFRNNWKQQFKMKNVVKQEKNQDLKHKFFISKSDDWNVHLKSIRTHFMQKIFYKIWKIPSQTQLKNYCFNGKQTYQQKIHIKEYLYAELSKLDTTYEAFPMKLQIYQQIIIRIIAAIDVSLAAEQSIDDLVFEVLFKGQIAELFY